MKLRLFLIYGFAALVAVGGLGGQGVPSLAIELQPVDAVTNVGGAASFRVVASGAPTLGYQWFRDGLPLAGATGNVLVLPTVAARDAGRYSVRIMGPQGSANSALATLTVQPTPVTPIIDPSFLGDASIVGNPTAFLPLEDGRVLLAISTRFDGANIADRVNMQLMRLLSDGRIDPGFVRGAATIDEFEPQSESYPPQIGQMVVQPDGRILVAGHFIAYNGTACQGLVRLLADGRVDPSFTAAVSPAVSDARTFFIRIALQNDGKILVLGDYLQGLRRLLPSGQMDPAFAVAPAGSLNVIALGENGRIFVGSGFPVGGPDGGRVIALRGDGSLDPTFLPYTCDAVQRLYPVAGGSVVVSTEYYRGPYSSPRSPAKTFRLRSDGTLDSAFPVRDISLLTAPAPDGSMLFRGSRLVSADGLTETSPNLGVGFTDAFGLGGFETNFNFNVFGRDGRLWIAGPFSSYNGVKTSHVARLNIVATEGLVPPRILAAWADAPVVRYGQTVALRVAAVGPGPLSYVWSFPYNGATVLTTEPVFTLSPGSNGAGDGGLFSVKAVNSAGSSAPSLPIPISIQPGELKIIAQPRQVSLTPGRWAELSLQLAPTSATYGQFQWRRNGVVLTTDLNGRAGVVRDLAFGRLTFGLAGPEHEGIYTVTLTDAVGQTVTSDPIVVRVRDSSRFTNLSTRAQIGAGDQAAILGFVIPPGPYRAVLVRGIGPSLASFGVAGTLGEARLDLFDSAGRTVMRSKSWGTGVVAAPTAQDFDKVGAFALTAGSRDAGLMINLGPGSYTARLSGVGGATGVGLVELYESDNYSDRLVNLSSRVAVPAAGTAIAGFAIRGSVSKRVLVRAAGPALGAFGVAGALANPRLEIRDGVGRLIAANDDWQSASDGEGATAVATFAAGVGAFAFTNGAKDAGLVVTLAPGNFSAVVTGAAGESGVVLVEVYEAP